MTELIYKQLSYKIVGVCMEAHNNLGNHLQEKHYSREVENILKREGISYFKEKSVNIKTPNGTVGKFYIDYIIEDKIVLELKTVPRLDLGHKKQVLRYLDSGNYKLGILVNFRAKSLDPIRIINAKLPSTQQLRNTRSLARKFATIRDPQITVILDNIRSALNVGAIFRTCDATNIEKLCLCGITAYPPHNKIPKTALGAIDTVPWEYFKSTKNALTTIQQSKQAAIVAVELTKSAKSIWDYKFKTPVALVFGNEITGVSEEVLEISDAVVKIPMFGKKESLNVATSCGVALYEVLRQING